MTFDTTKRNPAPPELRLKWLLEELAKTRELLRSKRTDALALVAAPPDSQYPAVTEAKLKTQARLYSNLIATFDWYLSKHRPWNKPVHAPASIRDDATGSASFPVSAIGN